MAVGVVEQCVGAGHGAIEGGAVDELIAEGGEVVEVERAADQALDGARAGLGHRDVV